MTDPIADMLTRIRNAQAVRKAAVRVPYSKMKRAIADILLAEGYVTGVDQVTTDTGHADLEVTLKYVNNTPAIQEIRRISSPGRRQYVGNKSLPYVYDNLGIAIISTSRGIMTNKQARKDRVGGEVLCEVF